MLKLSGNYNYRTLDNHCFCILIMLMEGKETIKMVRVYRMKKGVISFRQKEEFNSFYAEVLWRFKMMIRGFKVKEIK